ncbi:chorion peroxidase-like [Centruroides vittatus]|uniref:chorion peroxidase-like n=1 Tax=Centruroides vittatus TaxID=120091 RepID=UPI0035105E52
MKHNFLLRINVASVTNNTTIKKLKQVSCSKKTIKCTDRKYRRIDGKCNNLMDPYEGSASSCHLRFIPPSYDDGVKKLRNRSFNGNSLPEPRQISIALTRNRCRRSSNISNIFQAFGQFIAHDMSLSAQTSLKGKPLQCCPNGSKKHPECFPIRIKSNDPDFSFSCLNFVRSQPCNSCSFVREQVNLNTPTLDCSHIYGIKKKQLAGLRRTNGKMLVKSYRRGVFPPPSKNPKTDQCSVPKKGIICPLTGDIRSNENPLLLSFHTIFLRLHNIIANRLRFINSHWNGETIFQESRRLVIAIFQHIVYCEYLPVLFGSEISKKNHLCDKKSFYNRNARLGTWNEWAAAMFRIGHPTVPDYIKTVSRKGRTKMIPLKKLYFNFPYVRNNLDNVIRGAISQNQVSFDRCMSKSVTKFLYTINEKSPTIDLASINIQRGRDHGIPPYKRYFIKANPNKSALNFKELLKTGLFYNSCINKISKIYRSLEDVDLFVGLMCEKPVSGGVIGPTAVHFNMMQFQNLRAKDRYFYTAEGQTGSFEKEISQQNNWMQL